MDCGQSLRVLCGLCRLHAPRPCQRLHADLRLHQSVRRGGAVMPHQDLMDAVNSHHRVVVWRDFVKTAESHMMVWSIKLDGKYYGPSHCYPQDEAYRKAAALIAELDRNAQ